MNIYNLFLQKLNVGLLLILFLVLVPNFSQAESIPLKVFKGPKKSYFTYSSLKTRKDYKQITIPKDASYKNKETTLWAVPLKNLFNGFKVEGDTIIQFNCTDGFSAPLDTELILNNSKKGAIAYLAIEDPLQKWQPLPNKRVSAGPYRIVWLNPEKSRIVQEQWPYMISSFEIKKSLRETYPKIFPSRKLAKNDPINLGFKVFRKNCFACHSINGQGEGDIGPDLNLPMNPTEYFKLEALKKLIRNPQSVRRWKSSKMPDFDKSEITDKELGHLIRYLKHMRIRKAK